MQWCTADCSSPLFCFQLGYLQLELGNLKLQQEARLAEVETKHRKQQEEAEQKVSNLLLTHQLTFSSSSTVQVKQLQAQHAHQVGELVAQYARHNLHTDVVRLQSRLEAKEVEPNSSLCFVSTL